ncbi:MAG TPA: histidine triad nucleotide-binding protein [Syntrophales bacterium]|nr:histidine triad nucleotide-binding protein [Syntrophales bacterium]HOM07001.1 histidine triad nucleotide-binding protein [Syntrophales bacterium]HON99599.1 histidine triad nucleotide-binding protein [Syntrophales bacterium]HPC01092.1 histidine triad nucleotide-binding protein [Syntrophales bacterium]HPQ06770.1 histidine triad nucleotide-binding protein [Syntrophales bacterium]
MSDCIFCRIVNGEIPSTRVYEDDLVLAFEDIHPMAPVHCIVVPKIHIATLMDVTSDLMPYVGAMTAAAQEVAKRKGISEKGFRTVINCNAEGGQVVFHLHMHVLGGRKLRDELG